MAHFAKSFSIVTKNHNEVVDITEAVRRVVGESGVRDGQLAVYTPHATASVTVNENDDPNIGGDFLRALSKMVPEHDGWLHDRVDNNAAAHIKSALVGPSVVIPRSTEDSRSAPGKTCSFANSTVRAANGASSYRLRIRVSLGEGLWDVETDCVRSTCTSPPRRRRRSAETAKFPPLPPAKVPASASTAEERWPAKPG